MSDKMVIYKGCEYRVSGCQTASRVAQDVTFGSLNLKKVANVALRASAVGAKLVLPIGCENLANQLEADINSADSRIKK